jgi:hypothetical protein
LIQYKIMNQSSMNYAFISQPYLPPLPIEDKYTTYTLVLDLDETLVHYVKKYEIFINLDWRTRRIISTSWCRSIYSRNGQVL